MPKSRFMTFGKYSIAGLTLFLLVPSAFSATNVKSAVLGSQNLPVIVDQSKRNHPQQEKKPYVLLISIDGFRHDYIEKYKLKNITQFAKAGVKAKSLIPSFPSKTFPNHYTIVTGLHPGNHGIVANRFYDPDRKSTYALSNRKTVVDGSWYGGTPIWVAAEQQGMLSASFFWVGSEADIQGVRPTYYYDYNDHVPHKKRINQVINWFKKPPGQRPHFVTLYFSTIDSVGHKHGTNSKNLRSALLQIDKDFGELQSKLQQLPISVNTILVSDHGMVNLDKKKTMFLEDYIDLSKVKVIGRGSGAYLYVNRQQEILPLYRKLKDASKFFIVHRREKSPAEWSLKKSKRSGDLIIDVVAPYTLLMTRKKKRFSRATHGYNPYRYQSMHGIFIAKGPNISGVAEIPSFSNVHIYPFVMKILGLNLKNPIGRFEVLQGIYQKEKRTATSSSGDSF